MTTTTRRLQVAKATDEEVSELQSFIMELDSVLKENECYDTDDSDVNQEIADMARKLPQRAFIVPLNCGILLDNYQDKESTIIEHPKWIKEINNLLSEMDEYLSENPKNYIGSGSIFHNEIKRILKDE